MTGLTRPWAGLDRLRRYVGEGRQQRRWAERCDLCGVNIEPEHGHLANPASRTLLCVCRPCYLLFTHEGAGGVRFRAVPNRYQLLSDRDLAGETWDSLQIPIGLAFFFRNSATGRVTAFYPSPAGATESELSLDAWDDIVRAVPALETLVPDVEALLVRRRTVSEARTAARDGMEAPLSTSPTGHRAREREGASTEQRHEGSTGRDNGVTTLIVPIDVCYELVGRIRRGWRGFQGGDDVWREIDAFFARMIETARNSDRSPCVDAAG